MYVPEDIWLLLHNDKRRTKHAACTKWDGQGARSHRCRSSFASFNVSQLGHEKPWRAKTRYQAFPWLLALSLFVSLSLTHSVSSALSAVNLFLQCPTLALGLILLSTCMIKEAARQSAAPEATSDSGGNKSMWLFKGRNAWLLDLALCEWEQSCIIWVLRHQECALAQIKWLLSWVHLLFNMRMKICPFQQ